MRIVFGFDLPNPSTGWTFFRPFVTLDPLPARPRVGAAAMAEVDDETQARTIIALLVVRASVTCFDADAPGLMASGDWLTGADVSFDTVESEGLWTVTARRNGDRSLSVARFLRQSDADRLADVFRSARRVRLPW
jgi:hypothetical protein